MRERYKGFQILLIIGISFWFLVFPAYLHFSALDELDIISPHPCFKNIDQEDSIVTAEKEKILGLNLIVEQFLENSLFVEHIPTFFPQISFLNLKSLVLRC
jgi:hypothetical protein